MTGAGFENDFAADVMKKLCVGRHLFKGDNFEMCNMLAEQGIHVVLCSISMYNDCRAWARENIEKYCEIYIKAKRETLYKRDQKGLYSSGMKNVVGVDLLCEEPEHSDFIVENDGQESPEEIVERLERTLGLGEAE